MKTRIAAAYGAAGCFMLALLLLSGPARAQAKKVKVIEIRNYLLRAGQRDNYIEGFETMLMDTLNARGNYVLGQYRVKGEKDHFVWIRGFDDMPRRKEALESFFASAHWAKYQSIPGKYLVGFSNVHLLKPLDLAARGDSAAGFATEWFGRAKGVAVVDYYVANEKLNELVAFVDTTYARIVRAAGVRDISYWVSEMSPNTYPGLPVFQDKNLLVTISFFKDEAEYLATTNRIEAGMREEVKFKMGRIVTTKSTLVLYPTMKSFTAAAK